VALELTLRMDQGRLPLGNQGARLLDLGWSRPRLELIDIRILDSDLATPGKSASLDREIVTGTIAPSQQPPSGLATLEISPSPAGTPGVDDRATLDIPDVEMPAVDPELTPEKPAPSIRATLPVEISVPPPELPPVIVALPAGLDFAAEIVARSDEGLALARLAERERNDIRAAYEANQNRPFWIDGRGWSPAAQTLVTQIGRAGDDGLRPSDYPLPVFEASNRGSLAEADIRLSALAVLYARDAQGKAGPGGNVKKIEASGGVAVKSKDQVASADKAIVDMDTQIASLSGNVSVSQGNNIITGCQITINMKTNNIDVKPCDDTGGGSGRVKVLIDRATGTKPVAKQ